MLVGDAVCLAPVLLSDAPIFYGWLNKLDVAHANGPYRPMDQMRFDQWFGAISSDPARVVFAIRRRSELRLIGYVQIINIHATARSAELGILIGEAADRGQGLGRQALELAVGFCWRDLNLQRIGLMVVGDNPGAVRVYERTGFQVEGLLRRASYVNGAYRDVTVMGLLRPLEDLG